MQISEDTASAPLLRPLLLAGLTLGLACTRSVPPSNSPVPEATVPAVSDDPRSDDRASRSAEAPCLRPWMHTWVEGTRLALGACHMMELDTDAEPERVAQACSADGYEAVYLVDDGDSRWSVPHEGWGHVPICDATAYPEAATSLLLADTGPGEFEDRRVALRGGRPVVLGRTSSSSRDGPVSREDAWDFEQGWLRRSAREQGCARPAVKDAEGAIVVLGGPSVEARWIVAGASFHHGDEDARLRARVTAHASGAIRVHVEVDDDEPVTKTKRARRPADTVVLRWAESAAALVDPQGCHGTELTTLTVERGLDGSLLVSGKGAAAATVEGSLDDLTIDLDLSAQVGATPWQLPFSIELVDVDTDGIAKLATSTLVDDQAATLGVLMRNEDDGALPTIGDAVR